MTTATRDSTTDTTATITVPTSTYNSFITAGYDTSGTKHGVYLKDITQLYGVDDTQYTITKDTVANTIYLNTYIGSSSSVVVPISRS